MRRPGTLAVTALAAACGLAGACVTTTTKETAKPATISPEASYATRSKLAQDLAARGDWGRAFDLLNGLHREKPKDPTVLTLRGIVYRERGLFADAENDLKAALAESPDNAEAHAALGILYDVLMRPDAETHHREAVRLAPQNAAYLNNLGFSLFLRQRFKQAVAEYEKAARLAPLSKRLRTNLGFACAAMGDWRRAAIEFRMGGSEAEAKNNLGFAYERRGDLSNAYDLYLEAVRLDPSAEKPRFNLVHAATALGRPIPPEARAVEPQAAQTSPERAQEQQQDKPQTQTIEKEAKP